MSSAATRTVARTSRQVARAASRGPLDLLGDVQERLIDGTGSAAAAVLRAGGAETTARRVRNASRELGDRVDRTFDNGQRAILEGSEAAARWTGNAVATGARAVAGGAATVARTVGDAAGTVIDRGLDLTGDVQEALYDGAGAVIGGSLEALGAERLGQNVRRVSSNIGDSIDGAYDVVGEQAGNFTRGFTEGAAGAAEGLGELVANPVGTVRAAGQILEDPSLLLEGYRQAREQYGIAGALGAVTFDVVGTVASAGGTSAARVSSTLGRAARATDNLGATSRFHRVASSRSNLLSRGISRTQRAFDGYQNFRQRRWSENLGRFANRLHNAPFVPNAVPSAIAGAIPRLQAGSRLSGRINERIRQALPGSVGERARALRDTTRAHDAAVTQRIEAFRPELDRLYEFGPTDPAAVNALRSRIEATFPQELAERFTNQVIDIYASPKQRWGDFENSISNHYALEFASNNTDLAARLDGLATDRTVPNFEGAQVLANDRVSALQWIRENPNRLSGSEIATQVRDIFTNSNPRASVSILELPQGTSLGRVYSSNKGDDFLVSSASGIGGNYFSTPDSLSRYSPRGHQEVFALPADSYADRAALIQLTETDVRHRTVLATQTAPQLSSNPFGQHAIGGDWQFRLFDNNPVYQRVNGRGPEAGQGFQDVQLPSGGELRTRSTVLWQLRALRGVTNRSTDSIVTGQAQDEQRLDITV